MHLVLDGKSEGPFTVEQVRAMWTENRISGQTLFFREGLTDWQRLEQILPELFPAGAPSSSLRVIPGFWRRLAGVIIDLVVLGIFGFVLGSVLFHFFVELGAWARLVGFVIAAAYFGVLDSLVGGGQTVGKMALRLRVVGRDGQGITLGKSLLRFSFWGVPYFLNELPLKLSFMLGWPGIVLGLFLWTALFAIVYLLVANRRTRQSVHDLLTDTYVVRVQPEGRVEAPPVWKGHYAIIGAWFVLGLAVTGLTYGLSYMAMFSNMLTLSERIETLPDVQRAGVVIGSNFVFTNGRSSQTKVCTITVNYIHSVKDVDAAAKVVAAAALTHPEDLGNPDLLSIKLCRSYDMGIASGHWVQVVSHSPDQWRALTPPK